MIRRRQPEQAIPLVNTQFVFNYIYYCCPFLHMDWIFSNNMDLDQGTEDQREYLEKRLNVRLVWLVISNKANLITINGKIIKQIANWFI